MQHAVASFFFPPQTARQAREVCQTFEKRTVHFLGLEAGGVCDMWHELICWLEGI